MVDAPSTPLKPQAGSVTRMPKNGTCFGARLAFLLTALIALPAATWVYLYSAVTSSETTVGVIWLSGMILGVCGLPWSLLAFVGWSASWWWLVVPILAGPVVNGVLLGALWKAHFRSRRNPEEKTER